MRKVMRRNTLKRLLVILIVVIVVEWNNGVIFPILLPRAVEIGPTRDESQNAASVVVETLPSGLDVPAVDIHGVKPDGGGRALESIKQPVLEQDGDKKDATMVVIHSYQRTGSSFLGEMFNWNPDVFYWFEPVDAVYSYMYGTVFGFNAPSDIMSHPNGSVRALPSHEVKTVAQTLVKILHCDFEGLTPSVLVHKFMKTFKNQQHALLPYHQCLKGTRHIDCSIHLKAECSKRFQQDPAADVKCYKTLRSLDTLPCSAGCYKTSNTTSGACAFCRYKVCQDKKYKQIQGCLDLLTSACRRAKIRAIKTVRLKMAVVKEMMEQEPSLKVIHHYRDPRAVVLSRNFNPTFHGQGEGYNMTHEAGIYCNNLLSDVVLGNRLKYKYNGAVLDSLFESLAERPVLSALQMYSFLGHVVPQEVKDWLHNNTHRGSGSVTSRNSKSVIMKWMSRIRPRHRMGIDIVCNDLYKTLDYPWPMLEELPNKKDKKKKPAKNKGSVKQNKKSLRKRGRKSQNDTGKASRS